MSKHDDMTWLGRWEGYHFGYVERVEGARPEIYIYLTPAPLKEMICSGCGGRVRRLHEIVYRQVRDLPILDAATFVVVPRRRVACPSCGPRLERLPWLGRYARVSKRLAESVAQLCAVLPIKHVAAFFGLSWGTVKAIDKRYLAEQLGPIDLSGVRVIAMDEFALQKGQRYATVIIDPTIKKVLWVGRGRSGKDIRPFFEMLGEEGRKALQAVVMDMSAAYEKEVRYQCPKAEIVYDLFHVAAKYGREVIDRVRVDEANRLRHDKPARKLIKGAKWLLLMNRENIGKPEDRVRLDELLAANQALMTAYVLKDDLKQLWRLRDRNQARWAWSSWASRARESGIAPLVAFVNKIQKYLGGILAHCHWPLNTSLLEGFNNKIKVIKRMAYGFRDHEYFFLKIRAAFPGI